MYNWTIHWASTPYAPWALFILAFAEASFFPIPPDVLLMAMALGTPRKSLRYSAVCTAGSVLGGCFGYLIGLFFFEAIGRPLIDLYGAWSIYQSVSEGFQAHGFFWIFTAALTPIPYKVFTIAAGACKISFAVLVAASVIGRGIRFYAVGGLFRIFGAPIKKFIDRYFNLLTVAFVVILVGGFIVVKILWPKENARPDPQGPRPALEQPVRDYNAPARPEH
jgi:membrane protein YqaA with SNARE-associated domain